MACEVNNRDRLSALPDDILCHILSFIPTIYSVQSSVLSTRWKNLFTHIPSLNLNSVLDFEYGSDGSFTNFVNSMLLRYGVANMRKFNLQYPGCDDRYILSWISDAIFRNVREIHVVNDMSGPCVQLPVDIYTSKTLVELSLSGNFNFNFSDDMCLPSLKTLHLLRGVTLSGESKHLRFSTFPVLEDLSLEFVSASTVSVDISVMSLKILELRVLGGTTNIVLNAPALEFLKFNINGRLKISGDVLKSLVRANIATDNYVACPSNSYGIREITKMVSNVRNMRLSYELIKAIAFSFLDYERSMYQNLTCLELLEMNSFCWKLLPEFLKSSPNLEILIFQSGLRPVWGCCCIDLKYEMEKMIKCDCFSLHLREIQIRSFAGEESEFERVEYFLKNAKVLQKLVINLENTDLVLRYVVSERLRSLPKYARNCQIMVLDKEYDHQPNK